MDYWLEKMLEEDLWVAKVQDMEEVEKDPQVQHMGVIKSYQHPVCGDVKYISSALTMSETPPSFEYAPPMIGEQTREIMKKYGYEDAEIQALFDQGILYEEENHT